METKLKKVSTIIADFGLEEYGEGHRYFAERCRDRMQKYTPNSLGTPGEASTLNSPRIDSECNIVYNQAYAGYQYYGQRLDGSHKVNNYTTPGTGPYWDKEMVTAEGADLTKDMADFIKERGNK